LVVDDEVKALVTKGASGAEIREAATRAGMWSLAEDGLEKIILGMTSPEEVLDVVYVDD